MISTEEKKRVLVVEDDEGLRKLISRFLEKNEFVVHSAGDGSSAFRMMQEHKPDIAFLDVMLPDISGLEICRQIKGHEQFKHMDVIFVSARAGLQDRLSGYLAGARRYLCKPFHMEDLLEQVVHLSGNHNGSSENM